MRDTRVGLRELCDSGIIRRAGIGGWQLNNLHADNHCQFLEPKIYMIILLETWRRDYNNIFFIFNINIFK